LQGAIAVTGYKLQVTGFPFAGLLKNQALGLLRGFQQNRKHGTAHPLLGERAGVRAGKVGYRLQVTGYRFFVLGSST
jgi:hypothetical protein